MATTQAPGVVTTNGRDAAAIIVTGERLRRSVRETASSVQVVTATDINAQSLNRTDQLLELVPNVQQAAGSQGPVIRGLDSTGPLQALPAFLGGNRPRTTLIVDGRRQTYNEFIFGSAPLWDIARVEVFRSPQTTTQGQNSIAGAIFVHSVDPGPDAEARVRLIGGERDTRQMSALVSTPLGPSVAVRVSGDLRRSRPATKIADFITGAPTDRDDYSQARAKLLIAPQAMPDFQLRATYTHTATLSPQVDGVQKPFRRRRDPRPAYGVFRTATDTLVANGDYRLGETLSASLTASAGSSLARRFARKGFGITRNRARDWSGEFLMRWDPEGPIQGVAGVAVSRVTLHQAIDLSAFSGIGRFHDRQTAFGLFGEASISPFPRATLTVGLRYQHDRQVRSGLFETQGGGIPLDYDKSFGAWLPKLSFAYDFTPDVRGGLLVQRATNPGGTTLRLDTGSPDEFRAERLWDYEAFVRARLGDSASLSANLFYYDMRDAQRAKSISILAPNGLPVGFDDLFNASKARSYGAEAELRWRPAKRLDVDASVGFLSTKIVDAGLGYEAFAGNEFDRSPHMTASAMVRWRPVDRAMLSGSIRHHGAYFSDEDNDRVLRIAAATTLDARIQYDFDRLSLFAYARNLLDHFAMTSLFTMTSGTANSPRELGAGLEARF